MACGHLGYRVVLLSIETVRHFRTFAIIVNINGESFTPKDKRKAGLLAAATKAARF